MKIGRSSGTGLPHMIEIFKNLTQSGEDFDCTVRTTYTGSVFKVIIKNRYVWY